MENQFRDVNSSSLAETATGTAARIKEQVGEKAADAKDAVERVADAARATTDTLHATADYVRNQDIRAIARDVEDLVRRYPGPGLAIAAAVGFMTARVLSRD